MYKIMIVDDEAVVREGIRDNINWSEFGFEFVGDCIDGKQAMEVFDKLQPDVVLTDINMPFTDGLELTRYVMEKYPRTKVIILTGYDEFEYAQQAIKLKAYDFLLKPITARELGTLLKKIKSDLDEETKKIEDINHLKMQLKESLPLLKGRFLNRIISPNIHQVNFHEKLEYFDIHFKGNNFLIIVIEIDDYNNLGKVFQNIEDELLFFAIYNITEEIVAQHNAGIVFQNNQEKTIAILAGDNSESLIENANTIGEEVCRAIEKYLHFTVSVGLGNPCARLEDLNISYKGALSALDYRFLLGKNHVISISDMEGNLESRSTYKRELEKKLVLVIKTGTLNEVEEIIELIIESLRKSYISADNCYIHIQHAIISIVDALTELGLKASDMAEYGENPLIETNQIKTLDEVEKWLKIFCKRASECLSNKRNDFCAVQAQKGEDYIKDNYMDINISLNSISKHLSMSTSYFSLIFKNNTGLTYIEYLTKIRIGKAMELLKSTDLKSYEVAHRVGYDDPHYFSLIFKKIKGISPTEFRERM